MSNHLYFVTNYSEKSYKLQKQVNFINPILFIFLKTIHVTTAYSAMHVPSSLCIMKIFGLVAIRKIYDYPKDFGPFSSVP
jgi:hypothetical protein